MRGTEILKQGRVRPERVERAVEALLTEEYELFRETHKGSLKTHERALRRMPYGVGSSFQYFEPHPVSIKRAEGPWAWDEDGRRFLDLNMGFGALLVGHGHESVMSAVKAQLEDGTLFVAPSSSIEKAASMLQERFGHPLWRFCNSGTEATMTAVRLARAYTKREKVVKTEGGYHGHADTLLVSGKPKEWLDGGEDGIKPAADSSGVIKGVLDATMVVEFNDAAALERVLKKHGHEVAAFILEPCMENAGIILPEDGYLEAVREICDRYGVLLIFDEVKTGLTASWGGAREVWGVESDITCLAKSIGGGLPVAAFGGREDVMREIERGCVHQGTYNANPLCMAAVCAVLEVTTREALAETHRINTVFAREVEEVLRGVQDAVPTVVQVLGSKGSVTFSDHRPRRYRDWKSSDLRAAELFWMHSTNRGVLTPPGLDEQWLVSLKHTQESLETYTVQLRELCEKIRERL